MNCKFCDALLEEGVTVCPNCGKEQEEAVEVAAEMPETEIAEELPEIQEEILEELPVIEEAVPAKKHSKWWQVALACVGGLALVGVLVFAVLRGMGIKVNMPKNDITRKASYTEEKEDAIGNADVIVAKVGDMELSNGELQIYYWNLVFDHLNYYGTYFFSPYESLADQVYDETTNTSWEQYFLTQALETWHRYAALNCMAKDAGHQPTEDMVAYMEELPEILLEAAQQNGFETAEELLTDQYGETCTYAHYESYMRTYCNGLDYFNSLSVELQPTQQEIESYYTLHEAELEESGISKDAGLSASVYHILISPEGGTLAEDGYTTVYTDEAWADALTEAEGILAQWKEGEATVESFAALAAQHSDDTGVVQNGGFYTDITPTSSYVEEFRDWATSIYRQSGETAIVKTVFGYHIMYYVEGREPWIDTCREGLISERISARIDETMEENPIKVTYRKISLLDVFAATVVDPTEGSEPSAE